MDGIDNKAVFGHICQAVPKWKMEKWKGFDVAPIRLPLLANNVIVLFEVPVL